MTKLPRLQSPMVTVGGKGVELRPIAIGDYLGADADQNVCTGFLAATTVVLDVYSPYKSGGTACYETMQAAVQVLLAGGTGQTQCKTSVVRAFGENEASCWVPGALTYRVKLNRLLLDTNIIEDPLLLHDLHAFSLTLTGCGRTVVYTGCEFTSITRCCQSGGDVVEEAELVAAGRTEST